MTRIGQRLWFITVAVGIGGCSFFGQHLLNKSDEAIASESKFIESQAAQLKSLQEIKTFMTNNGYECSRNDYDNVSSELICRKFHNEMNTITTIERIIFTFKNESLVDSVHSLAFRGP